VEWRKLCNEELNDLYSSPNIVWVIKLRRMRWAGHVVLWGRGEAYTGFWWGNLWERCNLKDPGVDGRIGLRWISDSGIWVIDWIKLAYVRDRWWALVNVVMNLQTP
jgi:hypothetical protein